MLQGNLESAFNWTNSNPDALLVTLPCRKQEAEFCGVVQSNADGTVLAISYNSFDEANSKEEISIVAGIVYLKTEVAESVLSLSSLPELDSCTYIGSDNGGRAQQVVFLMYHDCLYYNAYFKLSLFSSCPCTLIYLGRCVQMLKSHDSYRGTMDLPLIGYLEHLLTKFIEQN